MIHYRSTFIHASFFRTCGEVYTRTACAHTDFTDGTSNGSDTPRLAVARHSTLALTIFSSCNENDKNQDEATSKQAQRDSMHHARSCTQVYQIIINPSSMLLLCAPYAVTVGLPQRHAD